jgi:predicted transcriptional regulator
MAENMFNIPGMPAMPGTDAAAAFWSDFFSKLNAGGPAPQAMQAEFVERWRKAFFEAMSRSAEEYMRSESFLKMMKQSMDHALAWQQTMNQQLQAGLAGAQMPSRGDSDHIVSLIRGMEDRVMGRLDELGRRVEQVEKSCAQSK